MSNALVNSSNSESSTRQQEWIKPHYRFHDGDDHYEVLIDLPGVEKSGIDLYCKDRQLQLNAARHQRPPQEWRAVHREVPWHDYRLDLHLDRPVDPDQVKAKMENGVLRLELPFTEAFKPRVIPVEG